MADTTYSADDRLKLSLNEEVVRNDNSLSEFLLPTEFTCEIVSIVRYEIAKQIFNMEAIVNNYGVTVDEENDWFYIVRDLSTDETYPVWDAVINHDQTSYVKQDYVFTLTIKDVLDDRAKLMIDLVRDTLEQYISGIILSIEHQDPTDEDPLSLITSKAEVLDSILTTMSNLNLESSDSLTNDLTETITSITSQLTDLNSTVGVVAAKLNAISTDG